MHKYLNILRTITIFATMMQNQKSIMHNKITGNYE